MCEEEDRDEYDEVDEDDGEANEVGKDDDGGCCGCCSPARIEVMQGGGRQRELFRGFGCCSGERGREEEDEHESFLRGTVEICNFG